MLNINDFKSVVARLVATECDWGVYNGKDFQCACGETHKSDDLGFMHLMRSMKIPTFGRDDAKVQMVISCPHDSDILTIIRAKYKYLVVFDRFESFAGCNKNKELDENSYEYLRAKNKPTLLLSNNYV
jgi:hypothetical protein